MEKLCLLILLVLLPVTNLAVAGFSQNEKLTVKQQLNLLNKPAIKSFQTEYGDILDCVEISKQLAFDHPSLKNHSIQMRPSKKIPKQATSNDNIAFTSSEIILPKVSCPRGTVPIKRITEEDLIAMKKFKPSMAMKTSASSEIIHPMDDQPPPTNNVATVIAVTKNYGVTGSINVWSPEVRDTHQFSSAAIYVASEDGSVTNGISAGWSVNPYIYQNFTRLITYWSKDSGKTGCFNVICPGFVQTSQHVPLGQILRPTSEYNGSQYYLKFSIEEDESTQNWWFSVGDNPVGYWPKELFTTLTQGATRAGWGGEVSSPLDLGIPAMGSGHFPIEGFKKAAFIRQMKITDSSHSWVSPSEDYLKQQLTNSLCYNVSYDGTGDDVWGNFMFFGGPPNCKL